MTATDLTDLLQRVYRTGWDLARALPNQQTYVDVSFDVKIDHENQGVELTITIDA